MATDTSIEWCDSTVNPTMGCDGCELWNAHRKTCYAGKIHDIRAGRPGYAPSFNRVTQFPGRMEKAARLSDLRGCTRPTKPWLDRLPRLIFISDMSDALSKAVPFEFLETEIIKNVISDHGQRHHWHWLTKRPERMAEFSNWLKDRGREWPPNLWAGTSLTTQATTSRIDPLLKVGNEDTIRFLSVEPQWEPIDLRKWLPMLDWVIQGGESGKDADIKEFELEWAIDLRKQCQEAGVAYFLKQLGRHVSWRDQRVKLRDSHGGEWTEWPMKKLLRRRQMPKCA
jgi:protein gp37